MIWGDIAVHMGGLNGGQGVHFEHSANPELLNAIDAMLSTVPVPQVRDEALRGADSVTAVRFVRGSGQSKDFGYVAIVVLSGAPAVVVRTSQLGYFGRAMFFESEKMAFEFVGVLKRRGVLAAGARVQFESVTDDYRYLTAGKPKAIAYWRLQNATNEKYRAEKLKHDLDVYALNHGGVLLADSMVHAVAWLAAVTVRHAEAVAAYQALGGLTN